MPELLDAFSNTVAAFAVLCAIGFVAAVTYSIWNYFFGDDNDGNT
jgi:hypothetical protein